ncbi:MULTISPECIES: response regulator [unclassified Oceanispirochaeta]|uniref:response regulator transcription factor n=1 Tax=unclassified Oceanispirochaeta TaxID=2635722 RepID=UPI000E08EF4C|nr:MULTISPECIES: response regulator [unclassified Oceanispirochaeta]MBF9018691.1 response regulator [Oceanispirochaeta sp. M2]NPD75134.1 response regulator [Oceanispirochaeta sp. M1]RDG29019.1 response regulator [Oceanispirochaeta sp. M1]
MYNVIICEDEDIIRKGLLFSFDFQSLNLKVAADFDNPVSCLEYLKNNSVDIVITDIKMPLMSGLEMISRIEDKKKYEFIILSGHSDFEYAKKAISYGVTEYLVKPLDHQLLEVSLKKAINNLNDKNLLNNTKYQIKDLSTVYKDLHIEDSLFQSIITFIKDNYMHKIVLNDVANELNYSISSIKNKLKEHDLTFNTTLNRYRIYKAIQFMNLNDLPIYKIAKMVGYSDYKYFCAKFKNYTGYSVTELVQKNQ